MISDYEIEKIGIQRWSNDLTTSKTILLGNGFSINIFEKFDYNSLFEVSKKYLSFESLLLFEDFNTVDFEIVLEYLINSKKVNKILSIDTKKIDKIIKNIKEGMIKSIHDIHPKPDELNKTIFKKIGEQLSHFSQIYTTNYDLLLYYISFELKEKYSDHFFNKETSCFLKFNEPDRYFKNHIYYLHGSLLLFEELWDTFKIYKYKDVNLIELISEQINEDKTLLYISEGNSVNKLKDILFNDYLKFCYNKLIESVDDEIIVFGHSLKEQDRHIVDVIDKNFKRVYVSVKIDKNDTFRSIKNEINRVKSIFKSTEVSFFESTSMFKI